MHIVEKTDNTQAVQALQKRLLENPRAFAVVVAGPSGVGKTTICRKVLEAESDVYRCVTTTTRHPRPEEVEGVERHFVSEEAFCEMFDRGVFIECAEVHGHLYGATLDAVDAAMKDGHVMLMDVDVQGVATWQKALGDRCVTVFVLPPTLEMLEERLALRQTETASNFQLRMKNAIEELRQASLCDYIIVNDHLSDAVISLQTIIHAERHRSARMEAHLTQLGLIED